MGWSGRTGAGDTVDLERGKDDARNVLLLRSYFERGGLGLLLYEIGDVARGVGDLCEGERRELHHSAHLPLRLDSFLFVSTRPKRFPHRDDEDGDDVFCFRRET